MSRIVRTIEELNKAQNDGEEYITVQGELADKLKQSKQIMKLSAAGLGGLITILGVATVTAPITGGLSYFVAAPVAALTGLEIAAIITASAIGITSVVAIFKGCEEISYSKGELKLRCKKNKNPDEYTFS